MPPRFRGRSSGSRNNCLSLRKGIFGIVAESYRFRPRGGLVVPSGPAWQRAYGCRSPACLREGGRKSTRGRAWRREFGAGEGWISIEIPWERNPYFKGVQQYDHSHRQSEWAATVQPGPAVVPCASHPTRYARRCHDTRPPCCLPDDPAGPMQRWISIPPAGPRASFRGRGQRGGAGGPTGPSRVCTFVCSQEPPQPAAIRTNYVDMNEMVPVWEMVLECQENAGYVRTGEAHSRTVDDPADKG